MQLFDLIKTIFEKPREWSKVSNHVKRSNFYMTQRFFSISYPMQANAFNNVKIDHAQVIDIWQRLLSKKYSKTPGWIYTKTDKKIEEKKKQKTSTYEPSEEVIKFYLEKSKMNMKDFHQAKVFMKDKLYDELKFLEKNMLN